MHTISLLSFKKKLRLSAVSIEFLLSNFNIIKNILIKVKRSVKSLNATWNLKEKKKIFVEVTFTNYIRQFFNDSENHISILK